MHTCDVLGTVRGPANWDMLEAEGRLEFRPLLATAALFEQRRPDVCGAQIFNGHPKGSPWYIDATGMRCDRLGASLFAHSSFVGAAVARDVARQWLVRVTYRGATLPAASAKVVAIMDDVVLAPATLCGPNGCPKGEVSVDIRDHYTRSDAEMTAAVLNFGPLPVSFDTTIWDRYGKTQT